MEAHESNILGVVYIDRYILHITRYHAVSPLENQATRLKNVEYCCTYIIFDWTCESSIYLIGNEIRG